MKKVFWPIDQWHNRWSKVHYSDAGITLCGRRQNERPSWKKEIRTDRQVDCKICLKIGGVSPPVCALEVAVRT